MSEFSESIVGNVTEVVLTTGEKITVFPISFSHMKRFNRAITRIVQVATALPLAAGSDGKLSGDAIFAIAPIVADEALDLVSECTTPRIAEVNPTMGDTARVVSAWLELNLREAQIRPLLAAVEQATHQITGTRVDLWSQLRSSAVSPPQDSPSTT